MNIIVKRETSVTRLGFIFGLARDMALGKFNLPWMLLRQHWLLSIQAAGHTLTANCQSSTVAVWPDWAIYWIFGQFLKPLARINLPKSPALFSNFFKGVKIYHFSSEIILGNFYSDSFWSHCKVILIKLSHQHLYCLKDFFQGISICDVSLMTIRPRTFQNIRGLQIKAFTVVAASIVTSMASTVASSMPVTTRYLPPAVALTVATWNVSAMTVSTTVSIPAVAVAVALILLIRQLQLGHFGGECKESKSRK